MMRALIGLVFAVSLFAESPEIDKLKAQKQFREVQLKAANDQVDLANAITRARQSQERVSAAAVELAKILGCAGTADSGTAECAPVK